MDIQNLFSILKQNGIDVRYVQNSPIRLQTIIQGFHFFFEHDGRDDPYYYRIVLPNVVEDNDNLVVDANTVYDFNSRYKSTKIIRQGTMYHIVSEQFIYDANTIGMVVLRVIGIMTNEIVQFHQQVVAERGA